MSLADKIRKAREQEVEAAGFFFLVRRPTDVEMMELRGQKMARAVIPYVIGWRGVTEISILGNGSPHPLDFDAEACAEWLQDRIDILGLLTQAIFDAYQAHAAKTEQAVKN